MGNRKIGGDRTMDLEANTRSNRDGYWIPLPSLQLLIVALALTPVGRVPAQTFKTLHTFSGGNDGKWPYAGLILSGNTLYGEASGGGFFGYGTVFALSTDGTGFRNLAHFSGPDGASPRAGMTLRGDTLYGTAYTGDFPGYGVVSAIRTEGTGVAVLYAVDGSTEGSGLQGKLTLSGNTLYGTASYGGSSNAGTVFALNTDGTGFRLLHTFTGGNDGGWPRSTLVLAGNTLYGTASGFEPEGWSLGYGTVFSLNTDGTEFQVLHTFTEPLSGTNTDGAYPFAGLILSGNTLYGGASAGGFGGSGTVFALGTNGTGFTTLYHFTATTYSYATGTGGWYTNVDGAWPRGGLILSNNTLYGTTRGGGNNGAGTVFALSTGGTDFEVLHTFKGSDGSSPNGDLALLGNTLYGTALTGGKTGGGTIFSIALWPNPTIAHSGSNVILRWPTSYAGFDYSRYALQSTTNLAGGVWDTNLSSPVVLNGQYTVTNPVTGTQQFFRLSQ